MNIPIDTEVEPPKYVKVNIHIKGTVNASCTCRLPVNYETRDLASMANQVLVLHRRFHPKRNRLVRFISTQCRRLKLTRPITEELVLVRNDQTSAVFRLVRTVNA